MPDPKQPGFEQALAELEAIVTSLEEEELPLDELLARFERGTRLQQHCRTVLDQVRERIEQIEAKQFSQNSVETEPEPAQVPRPAAEPQAPAKEPANDEANDDDEFLF